MRNPLENLHGNNASHIYIAIEIVNSTLPARAARDKPFVLFPELGTGGEKKPSCVVAIISLSSPPYQIQTLRLVLLTPATVINDLRATRDRNTISHTPSHTHFGCLLHLPPRSNISADK